MIRVPIITRTPLLFGVKYQSCKLCNHNVDCYGCTYSSIMRLICVPKDYSDWDALKRAIHNLQDRNLLLRLVCDVEPPKDVIWCASYSGENILQINIDLNQNYTWIGRPLSIANRCGVYCVLCVSYVLPSDLSIYRLIDIIDRCKCYGKFHVAINTLETLSIDLSGISKLNLNGELLPSAYVSHADNDLICSEEFKARLLEFVGLYADSYKVSVSICGCGSNCTGLEKSYE